MENQNDEVLPPPPLGRQNAVNFVYIHNGQQVLRYEVERNVNGVDMVRYENVQYPIENDANGLRRIMVNGVARYIVEAHDENNNVGGRSKRKRSKRKRSKRKLSRR